MISVGGGIALLCLAVCGAIMSDRPWVKVVSTLYLAFFAIAVIIEIVKGEYHPGLLIVPALLILLGLYVHGVYHIFDAKDRGRK